MRKVIMLVSIGVSTIGIAPPVQAATHATTCDKAYNVRQVVVKKHGRRAPGRNICRIGVKHSDGSVAKATYSQKKRYLNQLRKLASSREAVQPSTKPAGALTPRGTPSSNRYVDPSCESGGDPQATGNPGYWGKYQFDVTTWTRFGGSKSSYGNASEAEQDRVAANVSYDAWPNC